MRRQSPCRVDKVFEFFFEQFGTRKILTRTVYVDAGYFHKTVFFAQFAQAQKLLLCVARRHVRYGKVAQLFEDGE